MGIQGCWCQGSPWVRVQGAVSCVTQGPFPLHPAPGHMPPFLLTLPPAQTVDVWLLEALPVRNCQGCSGEKQFRKHSVSRRATSSFRAWQAPGVTGPVPERPEVVSVGKGSGAWQGQGTHGSSGVRGLRCPVSGQEASKGTLKRLLSPGFHGDPRVVEVVQVGEQGQRALGHNQLMASTVGSWRSQSVEPAGAGVGRNHWAPERKHVSSLHEHAGDSSDVLQVCVWQAERTPAATCGLTAFLDVLIGSNKEARGR